MKWKCVNKQTISSQPPPHHHHCDHRFVTTATTSHNHRSTTANHPNNDDNVATPHHQPNGWTTMTWHINGHATSSRWWWHMSSLFILIKVSVPPQPLSFSHTRSRGHVANGDVVTNNWWTMMTHGQMMTIHGWTTMTHWRMTIWHVNGCATSSRWWRPMSSSLSTLIQVSNVTQKGRSLLMKPMATFVTMYQCRGHQEL